MVFRQRQFISIPLLRNRFGTTSRPGISSFWGVLHPAAAKKSPAILALGEVNILLRRSVLLAVEVEK
jgi:hypothetical protein